VSVTATGEPAVSGNVFVSKTPEAFTYDLDGNMTSDGRWNYTWDAENRLIKVESRPDTPSSSWRRIEWTYDALGRRIQQVTSIWTNNAWFVVENLKFVSDPMLFGRHIVELNATNNTLVRSYAWGLDLSGTMDSAGGVGGLAWVTLHTASGAAAGTHFAAYDGNGNVVGLVSATTGTETARYEYGPFGEPVRVSGPAAALNPFRFSTKRIDPTTDLVLYEYRAYSLTLGRWLTRDPINEPGSKCLRGEHPKYRVDGELIDDTRVDEEKNLYHFVFNDPISLYDYLGLGHNFGRCCNKSGGNEWALLDGVWRMLKPGECTGILEDCDGMTCGGGFYYVRALEWASCVTPGCDSPPFDNRRWEPDGGGDPGGISPRGRGSNEGDRPPGYKYSLRPPCTCKKPRFGAQHNR
jgi:RHS repeat-associated protein